MSCGIAICSECRREVHQEGPTDERGKTSWVHCTTSTGDTPTLICAGATAIYADPKKGEPKGFYCGKDIC